MKIYTWNGETFNKIPDPLRLADGSSISPVSEEKFIELGGVVEDDGEPTHFEYLCMACDNFIEVCNDIGQFIGDPSFMGGITAVDELYQSQAAQENPVEALTLGLRWNAANTQCNFFADKPDLYEDYHSPKWYYFAWQRYADQLEGKKGK